jgi:hypothetical protein
MLTETLEKYQIVNAPKTINLSLQADQYEPTIGYSVQCNPRDYERQKYLCTAELPPTLKYLNYGEKTSAKKDDVYKTKWGTVPITFVMTTENVLDGAKQVVSTAQKTFMQYLEEVILGSQDKTIEQIQAEYDRIQQEEVAAAAAAPNAGDVPEMNYPPDLIEAP